MVSRETFLQIQSRLLQHVIRKSWIRGVREDQNRLTPHQRARSVPTVSQKFSQSLWGRFFKELRCKPTTIADFRSSLRQILHTSNICLLEDKIQDWGMYLFTISYRNDAMDQRSGDGWFSGWFKIFVINTRYFNAEFWSARCEDCFGTEKIIHNTHFKKKNQSGGTKGPERGPFPSRKTDCLPDLWVLPGHRSQWLSKTTLTCSLLFYEMMIFRNSIQSGT